MCSCNNILINTDWNKIKQDRGFIKRIRLKICSKRFKREYQSSLKKPELPLIPIITNQDIRHWPDYLKIVDIASKGIYIGVKYGYDINQLLLVTKWLNKEMKELPDELPTDLITIVIQYYMELQMKSLIVEPMKVLYMSGSSLSLKDMRLQYNKWITNIEIIDFNQELKEIADNHSIDFDAMKTCFDENNVGYSYFADHSRKDLTKLLHGYGISAGAAIKVHRILSDKREIQLTQLNVSNYDFSNEL